ncbi:hypothetical protein [Sphaerotilus sp.]|jgi:hypothetical protein|uniref:hypothetical protein n=1 Tax=Sphaerotilus sp. TaxID=2093942 RepID=UPI00286DF7BA|nr:hypothetical protein [Sphaerotilus sp.]
MQHFLVILLGLHLGIGLLLLQVGPLSHLMHESREDALNSRVILAIVLLLLWPCLWPTAVYRPQFGTSALTFGLNSGMGQAETDNRSSSSDALASAGWFPATGTGVGADDRPR